MLSSSSYHFILRIKHLGITLFSSNVQFVYIVHTKSKIPTAKALHVRTQKNYAREGPALENLRFLFFLVDQGIQIPLKAGHH